MHYQHLPRLTLPVLFSMLAPTVLHSEDQFRAQQQGQYRYSMYTAMASPVVLPMDGTVSEVDWLTGLDVSIGDKLFPHMHLDTAFGTASRPQDQLAAGHHDPIRRDGFTFQNLEFSISGRLDEHNEFFVTWAGNAGEDNELNGIWEEAFWKFKNIPGGFELRLGRVYNRFGIQNTYHPHGFDWVDQYLVNARLLGDDSLTTVGAEITWVAPVPWWHAQFDVALGGAPGDHEGHGAGFTGLYNPEEAAFGAEKFVTVANWTNVYNFNDFHQLRGGVSGAWGENESEFYTAIYGAHFEYQWRENGFEPGGQYFRFRTEAMFRRFQVEDEITGKPGVATRDFGWYASFLYGLPCNCELGFRTEYASGDTETEQDARFRCSPGITWYANQARSLRFRLQYNYDQSSVFGTDHGVWGQISLAWGGPEVR